MKDDIQRDKEWHFVKKHELMSLVVFLQKLQFWLIEMDFIDFNEELHDESSSRILIKAQWALDINGQITILNTLKLAKFPSSFCIQLYSCFYQQVLGCLSDHDFLEMWSNVNFKFLTFSYVTVDYKYFICCEFNRQIIKLDSAYE